MTNTRSSITRRQFLTTVGATTVFGIAGCSSSNSTGKMELLSAGSLSIILGNKVGESFEQETGTTFQGEFHGSNAVMRFITSGQKSPDVVASADAGLLRDELQPDYTTWDVVFASNSVGITYNPDTQVGRMLENGTPWYRALREADSEIAMSDPDLDPLGYRTVQMFKLAEEYYDVDGLAQDLINRLEIDPQEAHLLAGIETGDRAAAVCYKNMAVDHGLSFVSLPDELNFSNPEYADHYAQATYTTDEGTTIEGTPVLYNATVLTSADHPENGRRFLSYLLQNRDVLSENGLIVDDRFPRTNGDVPEEVLP
ncbi:extracellular solute-binding protein [Natribaculum luteum]|uniref:Extracellular solute-binding protein n=1 Tax=Natribaculum luteum TaxID=1586232 RepID=A0ABD5P049_9EURY|nr:extracellular solute-binding protein [Natribaculum luteum]